MTSDRLLMTPALRPRVSLLCLLVLAAALLGAGDAEALEAGGRVCTVADRGSAVWFGQFVGVQAVFSPMKNGAGSAPFESWRCFETEAECLAWTAAMTKRHDQAKSQAACRQGG